MAYTKKVWKDAPDTSTPINAANLNHMEDGIAEADVNAHNALDRLDDVDDEIAQINSDLTWKLVGRVQGSTPINIPSNFRELHVVVKCPSDNNAPMYVINHLINRIEFDNLSTTNNTWLVGGGAISNTNNFRAITIINASHTAINTANVDVNSQDYLPYAITELYYR